MADFRLGGGGLLTGDKSMQGKPAGIKILVLSLSSRPAARTYGDLIDLADSLVLRQDIISPKFRRALPEIPPQNVVEKCAVRITMDL
jgi:hypothetical protein